MAIDLNKGATVELVKVLSDDLRTGADGVTYDSAGAATRGMYAKLNTKIESEVSGLETAYKAIDNKIKDLPTYNERINVVIHEGKRWQYSNNFNLIDAVGYYACNFSCDESTSYTVYSRNIGTNETFAVVFIDGNENVIDYISDSASTSEHSLTFTTPLTCTQVKFTTNNQSQPSIRAFIVKLGKRDKIFVRTNGSDTTGDGSASYPFASIQGAIDSNYSDLIDIGGGVYKTSFICQGRKKIQLYGDINGGTIIDLSKTITTQSYNSIRRGSFSSTSSDLIYKVFVSKEISMSDSSGNATVYTVNLWDYYDDTKFIPVATVDEVVSAPNTWTYDGEYIYTNSTSVYYKLIDSNNSVAGKFDDIGSLAVENITFSYAGKNACEIVGCNNAKVKKCTFAKSGILHGAAIENTNGTFEKCFATLNGYDGLNIHNKGNTTFIDCVSSHNGDDGMSHHDGSTGTVIGGMYDHNKKGGISPTYDSQVNIYNAYCAYNGYGIYYAVVTSAIECIVSGCALVGNNGYGLRVNGYNIRTLGAIYSNNANKNKADGGGSIIEIG